MIQSSDLWLKLIPDFWFGFWCGSITVLCLMALLVTIRRICQVYARPSKGDEILSELAAREKREAQHAR
jgi:hypothetical protein